MELEHKEYTVELTNIIRPTPYYVQVTNWQQWDWMAGDIHKWMAENTDLGAAGCFGTTIYFNTEEELVWFKLVWGDNF